jgi:hypothetical protein
MKSVMFTQYMLPDGHKVERYLERPDDIVDQANQLDKVGVVLEMEMLRDMATVSLTAEMLPDSAYNNGPNEEVLAMEVVPNGPEIVDAVDRLITTAYNAVIGR